MSKKMIELPCDRCIHSKVCSRKGAYSKDGVCEYFDEKRPQGEWITHRVAFYLTCPFCNCNVRALKDYVFLDNDGEYNFCLNCGADMRKGGAEQR